MLVGVGFGVKEVKWVWALYGNTESERGVYVKDFQLRLEE
jgi:hypothetical protein